MTGRTPSYYFPTQHDASLKKIFEDVGNPDTDDNTVDYDLMCHTHINKKKLSNPNQYVYVPMLDHITISSVWMKVKDGISEGTPEWNGYRGDKLRPFTQGILKANGNLWQVHPDDVLTDLDYYDSVLETDGYVGSLFYTKPYIPLVFKGYKVSDPVSERAKHYGRGYLSNGVINEYLKEDELPPKDIFTFIPIPHYQHVAWKLEDNVPGELIDRLAFPKKYTPTRSIILYGNYIPYIKQRSNNNYMCGGPNIRLWRDIWMLPRPANALYPGSPSTIPKPLTVEHVRMLMLKENGNDNNHNNPLAVVVEADKSYWRELYGNRVKSYPPIIQEWVQRLIDIQTTQYLKKINRFIPKAITDVTGWEQWMLTPPKHGLINPIQDPDQLVGLDPIKHDYARMDDVIDIRGTKLALVYSYGRSRIKDGHLERKEMPCNPDSVKEICGWNDLGIIRPVD